MVCMHVCVRALFFVFVHVFNECVQYVYARTCVHMRRLVCPCDWSLCVNVLSACACVNKD